MGKFENLPKVGDRVKIVASVVVSHWNMHWAKEVGARLSNGDLVYVTKVTPRYLDGQAGLTISATPGGAGPRWTIDRFAPVETSTLTIEAGKFYKTRDGRKVGPMTKSDGRWYVRGALGTWNDDGTASHHHRPTATEFGDLVTEWVDEPKASNDNAATLGDILQAALGKTVTVRVKRPDFKVGDTVRFKQSYGLARVRGKEAKVINVSDWGIQVDMNGDRSTERPESIELVTPAAPTNPAIVCLIENGQPKPAIYPHVHADEGAASKEASRFASVHKGQKFGVYVLKQTVSEEKVYEHKWQNLAIKGEKISAIKELRGITGMGLKPAKDAVEYFLAAA